MEDPSIAVPVLSAGVPVESQGRAAIAGPVELVVAVFACVVLTFGVGEVLVVASLG